MQKYDVALKNILTRGAAGFLSRLMGLEVAQFLNSELPEVRSQRADLLGEATDGTLFHVELQSSNDDRMAFRMLEYLAAIEGKYRQIPRQLVLYVGEAAMRMDGRIASGRLSFEVRLLDIRDLDGVPLLESNSLDENIISVLAQQPDTRHAVRRILEKISGSGPEYRAKALQELTILAGLRSLGNFVKEESQRMPILTDIMDHDLLGPVMREGIAKGMATGRVEGMAAGRVEGERTGRVEGERAFFLKLIAKRFGPVPGWVSERIELLGNEELENLGVRFLDVRTLEELFGAP
jgi:predicted transposase YdaD